MDLQSFCLIWGDGGAEGFGIFLDATMRILLRGFRVSTGGDGVV